MNVGMWLRAVGLVLVLLPLHGVALSRQTYYLAPTGEDGADGRSPATPWRSFSHAFARMRAGDELLLLEGEYSTALGTGAIHYDGRFSAQPPSGASQAEPTVVRAQHAGRVRISGTLFIGRKNRKDSNIRIEGISFEGGGDLYNSSHVTLKNCGFHGALSVGTNDHHDGNTDNLIEDVWVWASGARIIAINYRSHRNVWRRVVVRGDGCGTRACSGSGNPNVGFTVYDSHDVSVQNMLIVDRILAPTDSPYSDFAVAQHTADTRYYLGRNEWLGTISLNSPDIGYYMEPDVGQTLDPTIKISNAVAWNSAYGGFNFARYATNNLIENLLAHSRAGDAIRVAPELGSLGGTLRNAIALGAGRYAINSAYVPSHVSTGGSSRAFNQKDCRLGCYRGDVLSDGSLKHVTRIEVGSRLKGSGIVGADIGPSILFRYGMDGARFGDPGFNGLSNTPLWPWPNEARIRREMCVGNTRGFCTPAKRLDGTHEVTLTSYIWEALGNPMPKGIYP